MSKILQNYSLKHHNTFGISVKAKYFAIFNSEKELVDLLKTNICNVEPIFLLGGGSNILLTQDFKGIVLANKIKGIRIIKEDEYSVSICVGAGEVWHNFVLWSIKKNLSGVENLALIPGLVGASPIQNIGAYGTEAKDVITSVSYIEIESGITKEITNKECNFGYRTSIFKESLKDKVIITHVAYKLSKNPLNNIKYGEIIDELKILDKKPSPSSIAEAVINIRMRKLPNPNKIGNAGSFFKNPIITTDKFKELKKRFPKIVGYKLSKTSVKISAGWLIDNAGLKGYRKADAGIHKDHALVLINYGNASGLEIINLAKYIQKKVKEKYKINIENEVNIL